MRRKLTLLLLLVLWLVTTLWAQRGWDRYALVLEDPPLAEQITSRKELERMAGDDRLRRIEAAQASLRRELEQRHIAVTGAVQTLLNAVFVRATADRLEELRSLPGVKRVAWLPPLRRHLDRAIDLVNARAAWSAVGGLPNAGLGVKIGILDTGIDHTHPAFQDPSLPVPAGYPRCPPADCPYATNKIIAVRSYVAQLAAGTPPDPAADSRPDDVTPRDRVGHGTAAAMIAAGMPNNGPLATITGVAPKAYLGNYKIFGSPGVNDFAFGDVAIQALDDAFRDGMDIVSLSIGSPAVYGPLDRGAACGAAPSDPCDIRAQAVQAAVSLGMTVVVSAGNEGDAGNEFPTLNTIATPGTAPAAITVGASTNSHVFFQSVQVSGDDVPANLRRIPARFGDGPRPADPLTAPLRDVEATGNDGLACTALPPGSLEGTIALVRRGQCFFAEKVNNAQNAGAVGVVIYRADDSDFPFPPAGLTNTGIPAVLIGGPTGQALKSFLALRPDRPVTLDPSLAPFNAQSDTMAFFSSRGPSIGENGIKPELVAVGTDMYTATQNYDPNSEIFDASRYTVVQGTSFSAPMVSGAAALVKQQRPAATPAQIKSALVNTASGGTIREDDGTPARVTAVGAGKLDVAGAVRTTVTVEPATLSFGVLRSGTLPLTQQLRVTNVGSSTAALTLAVTRRDNDPNTTMSLSPASLNLAAGQTATVNVQLAGTLPAPGTYEGAITVQGGAVGLRVPFLYVVSDGIPFNAYALLGSGFLGYPNQRPIVGRFLALRLLDRFGVPLQGVPVTFRATLGGGSIEAADTATDRLGIAAAIPLLGPQLGAQQFVADAGGVRVEFNGLARLQPAINTNGVVNAASQEPATPERGAAPGSYITIYGQALSDARRVFFTPYLPLALAGVSVSFDAPAAGISLPGRLHFVDPNQINVQVPWELEGLNSVRMKVSVGDLSSAVYTLPLARHSPAFFEYLEGSRLLAAALDENFRVIGTSNPVARGRVVQFFLNGLGPVTDRPATGEITPTNPLPRTVDQPTVLIAGRPAQVEYSGMAPSLVGVYQINARVPADAPSGILPVTVTIGGVTSKATSLPVE